MTTSDPVAVARTLIEEWAQTIPIAMRPKQTERATLAQAIAAHVAQAAAERDAQPCCHKEERINELARQNAQQDEEITRLIAELAAITPCPSCVQQAEEIARLTKARDVARVLLADDAKERERLRAALEHEVYRNHEHTNACSACSCSDVALCAPAPAEPRPEPA